MGTAGTLWEIYRGDCLPISLVLRDDTDALVNLTGYGARIEVKWPDGDHTHDSPTLGGVAGTIVDELTGAETEELPLGKRTRVSLVLVPPGGCERTLALGHVMVRE